MLAGDRRGTIHMWTAGTLEEHRRITDRNVDTYIAVAAQRPLVVTASTTISVWDYTTGSRLAPVYSKLLDTLSS